MTALPPHDAEGESIARDEQPFVLGVDPTAPDFNPSDHLRGSDFEKIAGKSITDVWTAAEVAAARGGGVRWRRRS